MARNNSTQLTHTKSSKQTAGCSTLERRGLDSGDEHDGGVAAALVEEAAAAQRRQAARKNNI